MHKNGSNMMYNIVPSHRVVCCWQRKCLELRRKLRRKLRRQAVTRQRGFSDTRRRRVGADAYEFGLADGSILKDKARSSKVMLFGGLH